MSTSPTLSSTGARTSTRRRRASCRRSAPIRTSCATSGTYSSICGRAPMTPSRAEDRKSTKTSPRRRPKRKTAALDTRAERRRALTGAPRADAPTVRREEIDTEFHRRQVAAVELVRFVHGGRGYLAIRKTARASGGTLGLVDRARRSQGAQGLRRSEQHAVLDRAGRRL